MTKEIRIDIKAAIALCQIIDEYETFMKNLKQFTKKNETESYIEGDKLCGMFRHRPSFSNRKIKKFYKENQIVINKLKEYIDGDTFVFYFKTTEIAQEFFQYLNLNRKDLNKILLTLKQLEQIGFRFIVLDETNDFAKTEYKVYKEPEQNKEDNNKVYFLENVERIPTYGTEIIKYQSQGSNYKIKFYYSSYTKCLIWDSTIFVNNLTFDVKLLPISEREDNLAINMWKEMITSLDTEKEVECSQITNAVNLHIELANLAKEINAMEKTLKGLKGFQETEELNAALVQTKVELTRMKQISEEYDRKITDDDSSITEDVLKRERSREQSRREAISNLRTKD